MDSQEDNTRSNRQITTVFLMAAEKISEKVGDDFFSHDFDGKKAWLEKYGQACLDTAKTTSYGSYFDNKVVLLVESQGAAILYFTKKAK